jgi:hypothetical protein
LDSLLSTSIVDSAGDERGDETLSERHEADLRPVLEPASIDFGNMHLAISHTNGRTVCVQATAGCTAAALVRGRYDPVQSHASQEGPGSIDEPFKFGAHALLGWIDTIEQLLSGHQAGQRSRVDGFTAGNAIDRLWIGLLLAGSTGIAGDSHRYAG